MWRKASACLIGLVIIACGQAAAPPATLGPSPPAPTGTPPSTEAPASATPGSTPIAGLGAFPPVPTSELPEDQARRLQAVLDGALDALDVPGIGAGVIRGGNGTWAGAAGTADGEAALDPAAQFGIGSVTKTVVSAQVLQLVESGAVDLDTPIAEYLPAGIPSNGATVRQVLGMRSGIAEPGGDVAVVCADLAATYTLAEMATVLRDRPLFEPGEGFRYTNANYLLAGLLIEEVTGTTVGKVLRSGVLASPGLERLVYQDEERPTPPLAAPFVVLGTTQQVPPPNELLALGDGYLPARCLADTAGPAGGMASDPLTLARWGYLLYGGSVLGAEILAEMTDFPAGYGLGVHDQHPRFGVPALGHEGTVPGYVAGLIAFPEEALSIAVLVNTNRVEESELTEVAASLRDALGG